MTPTPNLHPFPRGLLQPPGSFRFSMDALLLSAHPQDSPKGYAKAADLGTGCGVVALGLLARFPNIQVLGIEKQVPLVNAAQHNAKTFKVESRFDVKQADIAQINNSATSTDLQPWLNSCDIVLANPPYRILGTGRLPKDPMRVEALFAQAENLLQFCTAAKMLLTKKGKFHIVFPAEQRPRLLDALKQAELMPTQITTVYPRAGKEPLLILVAAAAHSELLQEDSLVLYQSAGEPQQISKEALDFCPFLTCNSSLPL